MFGPYFSSESFPKEFEKTTEVLPFTKYGLTSIQEFKEAEQDIQLLEWLKKAGLTPEEINLLKVNEAGIPDHRIKIETNARREKLDAIYRKINNLISESERYVLTTLLKLLICNNYNTQVMRAVM